MNNLRAAHLCTDERDVAAAPIAPLWMDIGAAAQLMYGRRRPAHIVVAHPCTDTREVARPGIPLYEKGSPLHAQE